MEQNVCPFFLFIFFRDNNFIKDFPQLADGLMVIPLPVEEQCRGVLSEPLPNLQLLTGEGVWVWVYGLFSLSISPVVSNRSIISLWSIHVLNKFRTDYNQYDSLKKRRTQQHIKQMVSVKNPSNVSVMWHLSREKWQHVLNRKTFLWNLICDILFFVRDHFKRHGLVLCHCVVKPRTPSQNAITRIMHIHAHTHTRVYWTL